MVTAVRVTHYLRKMVVFQQDSTLRDGGKYEIQTTRTTVQWMSWKKPFKVTSLLTLFHAAFPPLQASPARYISRYCYALLLTIGLIQNSVRYTGTVICFLANSLSDKHFATTVVAL